MDHRSRDIFTLGGQQGQGGREALPPVPQELRWGGRDDFDGDNFTLSSRSRNRERDQNSRQPLPIVQFATNRDDSSQLQEPDHRTPPTFGGEERTNPPPGGQWTNQDRGAPTREGTVQPQPAAANTPAYSGFAAAIKWWGTGTYKENRSELKWQADVGGEVPKMKLFQETMGALQDFCTYLFIKPGSAFVTVLHSPIKFAALTKGTQHLQGRVIGFVGDRTQTRDPSAIILPQEKTWKWKSQWCNANATSLVEHYANTTQRGKLWTPDLTEDEEELHVPFLLAIPVVLFRAIWAKGQPLMPHDTQAIVETLKSDPDDTNATGKEWHLISQWCLMAAHKEATKGDSLMTLAVDAVTEGDDAYLARWLEQRLDTTMGPRPVTAMHGMGSYGTAGPQDTAHVSALMATEVGKGVALGLRALAPLRQEFGTQKGGSESDGKGYTSDDIAALMGFAGVEKGEDLPDIWHIFNATKGKNLDSYRRHILARMKQWSYDRRITIDTSVYLEQEMIKAIVELRFNPGEGVAHIASASKGLSILACRARTSTETECIREQEHAVSATESTRQLDELLRLSKGTTRAPADNFWELKANGATFMALVWVLFGMECNYYRCLRKVYSTLEMKEVYALKAKFSPENCRQITWAILDDGRAYFDDVKTTLDFQGPERVMFSQSYLIDILSSIWYATPVKRASFPDEWKRRERMRDEQGGRGQGGAMGGGQQTGEGTPTRGPYNQGGGGGSPPKRKYGGGTQNQGQGGGGNGGQGYGQPGGQIFGNQQYRGPPQYPPPPRDWRAGWTDMRHPKIKEMMDPLLERNSGHLFLAELLDAAGKRQTDLPTLPKFTRANGHPFLCWNATLARCTWRDCKFQMKGGHPDRSDITDEFADNCVDVLLKGVLARLNIGGEQGSPQKKYKSGEVVNLA
jgi:hypothetical protein